MATPDRLAPLDLPGEASCGTAPGEAACRGLAVYLYGLIDGAGLIEPGIDAFGESGKLIQPILHRAGPIAALIGMVPLSEYCGAEAAHHLKDLAWLAPRTMQHAAVLRQAMQVSPVYPAPFATLFASRDSLSAFMLAHAHTLGEFFRAVAGMAEWELKASACLDNRAQGRAQRARDPEHRWAPDSLLSAALPGPAGPGGRQSRLGAEQRRPTRRAAAAPGYRLAPPGSSARAGERQRRAGRPFCPARAARRRRRSCAACARVADGSRPRRGSPSL